MKTPKSPQLSRRQLFKSVGAGAAASLVATNAHAREAQSVDVVVIGAGAAGCMAARDLVGAGKSVVLIEANDRIGGRLMAGEIAGQAIDLGGQWVGPQQTYALKLAEELGMTRYPMYIEGESTAIIDGAHSRFAAGGFPLRGEALMDIGQAFARMNTQAKQVPARTPWTAPEAKAWDAITVDTWMRENLKTAAAKQMITFIIEAVCSVEPSQISYLQWLFYIHSGESIEILTGTRGAAQQDLYVEGLHQIPTRIAASLGHRVVQGSPVRAIAQDENGVTVTADKGLWRAERVIITAPPSAAASIEYSPVLPYKRRGLAQRMPMGSVIKCFLAYDTPFWRKDGLSGEAYNPSAPFALCYDATAPDNTHGVLSGFFDGGPAQAWADRTKEERREQVIEDVARLLGKKAKKPMDYVEQNWPMEPWSIGGYTSIAGPGTLTHFGEALQTPCGRIHWGGTETSDKWSGYVEGALRSGERVAKEVLEHIQHDRA